MRYACISLVEVHDILPFVEVGDDQTQLFRFEKGLALVSMLFVVGGCCRYVQPGEVGASLCNLVIQRFFSHAHELFCIVNSSLL